MSLESAAVFWLRFKRRAYVILLERWPLFHAARPDVFAVTKGRETIEIEIKRTMSDFRANAKKLHCVNRDAYAHRLAHFTYFLVPQSLEEKVLPELPEWAGLMVSNDREYDISITRRAPKNKAAKKLSFPQVCKLGLLMGSQLYNHLPPGPGIVQGFEADYEI